MTVSRWEYKKLDYLYNGPDDEEEITILNEHGQSGWELVSTVYSSGDATCHYFKRPVEWTGT